MPDENNTRPEATQKTNILYMSASCPESMYEYLIRNNTQGISIAAHRFSVLLAEGLAACPGASVSRVVTNTIHQMLKPVMKDADYGQSGCVFLKLCRGRLKYVKFTLELLKYISMRKKDDGVTLLLCDSTVKTFAMACALAKWIYKLDTVAVVTDLPQYFDVGRFSLKKILLDKLDLCIMNYFSAYILLTEPMNRHVNRRNRPFIVIEGFCDICIRDIHNTPEGKNPKTVCVYAGTLDIKYNIAELVTAFDYLGRDDCELHIYGSGEYQNEVVGLINKCRNVKYLGVAPNSEILKAEREAVLLINPRPTSDEYTKYSFPSKTLEYMASGTPVLTTRLPGMPREYYPHVYFIEDETVDGMRRVLRDLLDKPREELYAKGMAAREFVLNEKNNIVQARKIFGLLESLSRRGS